MKTAEVLEFVIVPPYHRRDEIASTEAPFADYLKRRFRGYSFKIAGFAPVGDDDDESFHVIPVMNFIDDEGNSRMCAEPKPWIMSEIGVACREFAQNKKRFLAS